MYSTALGNHEIVFSDSAECYCRLLCLIWLYPQLEDTYSSTIYFLATGASSLSKTSEATSTAFKPHVRNLLTEGALELIKGLILDLVNYPIGTFSPDTRMERKRVISIGVFDFILLSSLDKNRS